MALKFRGNRCALNGVAERWFTTGEGVCYACDLSPLCSWYVAGKLVRNELSRFTGLLPQSGVSRFTARAVFFRPYLDLGRLSFDFVPVRTWASCRARCKHCSRMFYCGLFGSKNLLFGTNIDGGSTSKWWFLVFESSAGGAEPSCNTGRFCTTCTRLKNEKLSHNVKVSCRPGVLVEFSCSASVVFRRVSSVLVGVSYFRRRVWCS